MSLQPSIQGAVAIRCIDSDQGMEDLRQPWLALQEADEQSSVFLTWEWMHSWWVNYGKRQPLRIVVASIDERIVGILPLYIQTVRVFHVFVVRMLRFLGTGGDTAPDYLGPLVAPDCDEAVLDAMVQYIFSHRDAWDVITLSDLLEESKFQRRVVMHCAGTRRAHTTGLSARIVYVALPPSWDDYMASVSADRRSKLRRARKKAEDKGGARFVVRNNPDDVPTALNQLMDLHRRRWSAEGVKHSFSSEEYVAFHRAVVAACAQRGWIRFYCLQIDDRPIAMLYCLRYRNRVFAFQAGFDPEREELRPGLVLISFLLEHAIGEGNAEFDFLRGEHEYKHQWGKSQRRTLAITAYRQRLSAIVYRLRFEWLPALKRRIKAFIARFRAREEQVS